ncbi:MAG: serine hydrolase, partial [Flavobacteriaceae bacterium]|nr:serine hydrolase [Flavobacteriaceae bacterium]
MKKLVVLLMLLFVELMVAQNTDPLQTVDKAAQEKWVNTLLNNMTVEEKIGQLFMVQAYSTNDTINEKLVEELITKYHAGNLIFMQGTPQKQAELTNKYQALSKYPLLVAQDAEWGLDMRLKESFRYPWNMTLGAIRDNRLIEKFGEQLGKHCKRIGVHMNFAPVVDINTNPKNPIIGNRSFGENKINVTAKAIAFTRGMQRQGVLANAKHFPGHGDTATDSHHTLPVINFDSTRLDSLELYPYKELFKQGIGSVMTAHLSIPKLEPNKKLPSSLSKRIVTDLLIDALAFKGLIITDGLNMKGASNYSTHPEINLAAILAGNDMLLIPHEVPQTVALFKKAIKENELSIERLNASVRKVLKAKYWAGLHNYQPVNLKNIHTDINSNEDELLHRELVKKSITVLKNAKNIIPIQHLQKQKIAYIKLGDADNAAFVNMLKNYTKIDVISTTENQLKQKLAPYNLVIIGYHSSNLHPWKGYKFKKEELDLIQEIAKDKKVILDIFASPYSLLAVKDFSAIEGMVVSYQNSKTAQEISAQLLFGGLPAQGKLPVTVNSNFQEGFGLYTSVLNRLQYGIPEEVNMSRSKLAKIDSVANYVIKKKMAPGMQILLARKGKVVYQKSFGYHTHDSLRKVTNFDVYDVASLTKILATLPLVIQTTGNGLFNINTKLKRLLPEFKNTNKDTLTFKQILSHKGRLKAWIPFYKLTQDSITGKNIKDFYSTKKSNKYAIHVAKNLYLKSSFKDTILQHIKTAEQREVDEYKYSDLGYYLLKRFFERKFKKPLNKLVEQRFYASLGANRTSYLPLEKFPKSEIIPTE